MDRAAFYAALRSRACALFGTSLSQGQVTTLEAILDEGERLALPISHVAYCMASAYHEVGSSLRPRRESMNYSVASLITTFPRSRISTADAQRLGRQNGASGLSQSRQRQIANLVYGGEWGRKNLGNTEPDDGWTFRGGGLPQTTGRANYGRIGRVTGVDLVGHPEKIIGPRVAVAALVEGSRLGLYTGKRLSDFLPGDYVAARAIINGDVKKNGQKIAGHAQQFEAALNAGGYAPRIDPVPAPAPAQPRPASPTVALPGKPEPAPAATSGGVWAAILSILSKLFKGA